MKPSLHYFLSVGHISTSGLMTFFRSALLKWVILACNALQIFLIVRLLNADSYALYAAMYTNAVIAIGLARTPIESIFQRGVEKATAGYHTTYRSRDFTRLMFVGMSGGVVIFTVVCSTQGLRISIVEYFCIAFAIAIAVLSGFRRGKLIVENKTDQVDVADLLIRPIFFVVILSIARFLDQANNYMMYIFALSFMALLLPNLIAIIKIKKNTVFGSAAAWSDAFQYSLSNAIGIVNKNIDVVLVTYLIGGTAVGSYYIILRISDLVVFGNSYANLRYTHIFAAAYRAGSRMTISRVMRRSLLVSGSIAVAGGAIALGTSSWVLPLAQPGLGQFQLIFAIIVLGQTISGICGPNDAFLSILKPARVTLIKAAVGGLSMCVLVPAIEGHGLLGAAVVKALSIILWNVICFSELRRVIRKQNFGSELAE